MSILKPALIALFAIVAVITVAPSASATPITGQLNIDNCGGGGALVGSNFIDFQLPVAGGTGCIVTGNNTNVTYTGGSLSSNVTGTIKDLPGSGIPLDQFMTFTGTPLDFTLAQLGPGTNNTACQSTYNVNNVVGCSVSVGSPFVLTIGPGGETNVSLHVNGTVTDGLAGNVSTWNGSLTTQIPNQTPAQIQNSFLTNQNFTLFNTFSGALSLTPVPEPASLTLLGVGLIGAAFKARKHRRS